MSDRKESSFHLHAKVENLSTASLLTLRYKDPATGRDLQTTYTAGKRGFRARGPHIARRMDLSQAKGPFSRYKLHIYLCYISAGVW